MKSTNFVIFLFVLCWCLLTGLSNQEQLSLRVKRQSVSPFLQQQYTFSVGGFSPNLCIPGTIVGQVTAPGATYYTILNPNRYVGVNSQTGQVLLTNYLGINGPQTAIIRGYAGTSACVTNPSSNCPSSSTTITVTCTGGASATGGAPVSVQSTYNFQASMCSPFAYIGQISVTNPTGTTYTVSAGAPFTVDSNGRVSFSSQTMTTGTTQSFSVIATNQFGSTTIPVNVRAGCIGAGGITISPINGGTNSIPVFSSPSYFLSTASCVAGTQIGSVSISNPGSGATYSFLGSYPAFSINPSTGAITLTGNPVLSPNVQQTFLVSARNSVGSATTTVAVTPTCTGSTGTSPVFSSTSYFFQPTTCSTTGTVVGTASASSTSGVTYTLTGLTNQALIINPTTGVITLTGNPALTAGSTTSIGVVATNSFGSSYSPITITCSASNGGTGSCTFGAPSYKFTQASGCTAFGIAGIVAATCPSPPVTYTLPINSVNQFGIDPSSGTIYTTIPNTACTQLTVTARDSTGRTVTAPVAVGCSTATCTAAATTNCVVGTFGCADIG